MHACEWLSGNAAFGGEGGAVLEGDVEKEDLDHEHDHGLDEEGDIVFCAREVEDAKDVLVGSPI